MINLILSMYNYFNFNLFTSFPIHEKVNLNSDPSTDSWLPLILIFWLSVLLIPITLIRIIRKLSVKKS